MKNVLAMVLAGGRVAELGTLTSMRPKAAVPFGGQYLTIDFVMTNLATSGVSQVGILSQYRPSELIEHLGAGEAWDLFGRDRFAKLLPPYQGSGNADWYRGTADAVFQNTDIIESSGCDHVLVLSGDHIYHMDYRPLLDAHLSHDADLTAVFTKVPGLTGRHARYGVAKLDEDSRIVHYEEKPRRAASDLASLTVYLFKRDALLEHLKRNAQVARTHQIYDEILPAMVAEGRTFAWIHDGYWATCRTVDEYYRANMELVQAPTALPLDDWELRTNEETLGLGDSPPAFFGESAEVHGSRVSPGARIFGRVDGSIIAPGVTVAAGAVVRDAVLFSGCSVEKDAVVDRVIADFGVHIEGGARVGGPGDAPPNRSWGDTLSCGVTVLGRDLHIPTGCTIGRNAMIHAQATLLPGQDVPDASTVERGQSGGALG